MQKVTTKAIAKVAAVATGLAMATSMFSLAPMAHAAALSSSQIQSILSLLSSFGADASTIANVQASLTGGTPSTTMTTSTSTSACSFTKDLTVGSTGAAVTCLQNALKAGGYMTASATGTFGPATKAGVIAWQKAKGISPASGYFGAKSRAAFGAVASTAPATATTTAPATAGTGTGLKVSLSATSPNGTVLVAGQGIGDLGDFVFANPTASPINVTGLTFKRIGVSNDTTLTNVYLYTAGTRLTDSAGVSSSQFSFSSSNGIFTVPAGGTYTVSVRSDIATGTSGQQLGVSLVSATSTGTLDGSVSFPISSGLQTVSAATLAGVSYGATVTPSAATTISAQNNYPLWQNTVSVSSNPVKLTSMRFTNLGSTNVGDVVNLQLYVDGTMVGSTVPAMSADRTVTFDFSASPLSLSTSSHVIKVVGNILNSGAQKTITFSVQRASDGMFVDSQLGQPVTPTNSTGSAFSAQSASAITVQYASNAGVSVSLAPSSPSNNVAVGASNVKWASFQMLASGENVKITDLFVYSTNSNSTTGGLANGKVMVNGVQVGSTKSIGYNSSNSSNTTDFSLGSSLILPGGQTTTVDIFADAKTSTSTNLTANETVAVTLAVGTNNGQGQSSLTSTNVPASAVSGNTITVSSSSLTATKYSGYGNQTMIVGANNAKLGAFTLSTGSTEGVTVNTIYITFPNAVTSTITNLTLKDDAGNMFGTVQTTPSTSNSFSGTVDIQPSSTKNFSIYGNIVAGANTGTIVPSVGASTSGTGDITGTSASPSATGLQTITLGTGTLTVTNGPADPVSNNVVAGASAVSVGQFNFAATNSSYTVQNLAILVPNGQATSVTNVTLTYNDVNGVSQTVTNALQLPSATAQYGTATFTGLTMYVPTNDSANLGVSVGVPTLASNGASGTGINIALDRGGANGGNSTFRAINSAGSATTTPSAQSSALTAGGTFYTRKSVPTFAMLAAPSAQPSSGSALYRFSISADPAGAVEWTRLNFTIATSATTAAGPMLSSMYITNEASGVSLLDSNTTSATTTKTNVTIDLSQNSTQPKFEQIGAGSSKTYALFGTVSNWTTGSSLTINLAADSSASSTAAVALHEGSTAPNTIWSDRSASSHSVTTSDWVNGYLLRNFTTNATSYSK